MSGSDFEAAKAYLQTKQGDSSVYEHISQVLLKLVTEKPDDSLAMLEHISSLVKRSKYPEMKISTSAGASPEDGASEAVQAAHATKMLELFKSPPEGAADKTVEDLSDKYNYFEWAGVSIGREEAFRVHLALKHLAGMEGVDNVRFWGKILGLEADYYIAETTYSPDEEEEESRPRSLNAVPMEQSGTGANKHTYWFCHRPTAEWSRLPNVLPEQIVVARQIRRYFTGNPEAPVGGHPPFPGNGTEKEYLRAVIALISADTSISPAGIFVQEDAESDPYALRRADPDNEEEKPEPSNLNEGDNWKHHGLSLSALGRATPLPKDDDDEEGGEENEDEKPPREPLASIAEDPEDESDKIVDADGEKGMPAWSFRAYPMTGSGGQPSDDALVAVRSTRWPGAVAVGCKLSFVNVYVGYGVSHSSQPYAPQLPLPVQSEYDVEPKNDDGDVEEGMALVEQPDVTEDPDAGKEEEDEGGEGEDE